MQARDEHAEVRSFLQGRWLRRRLGVVHNVVSRRIPTRASCHSTYKETTTIVMEALADHVHRQTAGEGEEGDLDHALVEEVGWPLFWAVASTSAILRLRRIAEIHF